MAQSSYFTGPLYARMAEDLHLGGMSERTHAGYLRAVRKLADLLPDVARQDHRRSAPPLLSAHEERTELCLRNAPRRLLGHQVLLHANLQAGLADTPADEAAERQVAARSHHPQASPADRRCRQHAADGRLLLDRLLARLADAGRTQPASRRHRCRARHGPRASRQGSQRPLHPAAHVDAAIAAAILGHASAPASCCFPPMDATINSRPTEAGRRPPRR